MCMLWYAYVFFNAKKDGEFQRNDEMLLTKTKNRRCLFENWNNFIYKIKHVVIYLCCLNLFIKNISLFRFPIFCCFQIHEKWIFILFLWNAKQRYSIFSDHILSSKFTLFAFDKKRQRNCVRAPQHVRNLL